METKTMIQASANVLKVTTLEKGNVIKYIDESSYNREIQYGVVLDLLNSGTETFIQLLLYKKEYSDVKSEVKLFKGTEQVNIFPATVEEAAKYLEDAVEGLAKSIATAKNDLNKKMEAFAAAQEFVSGEKSRKLTQVSFTEISQAQFDEGEKQKKIEELNKS